MARAKGYRNYYEYRTLYDSGRIRPSRKPIPRGQRQTTRGHAPEDVTSPAQLRSIIYRLEQGDLLVCDISAVERDAAGRYILIEKTVIPADLELENWDFRLENITRARLVAFIDEEKARGVGFSPQPSLDQQRLVSEDDVEGGY